MNSEANLFNKKNLIIFVLTVYIFFWDMFLTLNLKIDIRLIVFLLFFYLLNEILKDIKNKNFKFIQISIIIFLFIVIHSILSGNQINLKFFGSVIFLIYLFGIAYYFYDIILENKYYIVYLFISLFLLSILIHFFFNYSSNPEPFSCGALKNLFGGKNSFDNPIFFIHFISSYSLIFNENSHLAMSSIAVIIFSIFILTNKNKNKKINFVLILFIIVCFLKSSATLLAGTFFSILCILIFEYKKLSKYFIFFSIIFTLIISFIFFQDKVCLNKFVYSTSNDPQLFENVYDLISDKSEIDESLSNLEKKLENKDLEKIKRKKILNEKKKLEIKKDKIKIKKDSFRQEYRGSLSSDVFFHALNVSYNSVLIKPFGWGFQGYEFAFNDYNKKNKIFRKPLEVFNNRDASNNTFKLITEFGILSLLIFFLLLYIFLSNKISVENKIFLIPFLVTQFIRGAGYFNSAFLLILFILITAQ
mgnify:FL=1